MLHEIFSLLDGQTLVALALVCRGWKQVLQAAELRYIVELWASGMVDVARGADPTITTTPLRIPFAEKLIDLLDHQRAWASLAWRSEAVVEVRPLMNSAYDFVGGFFCQQDSQTGFRKISLDSAIAQVLLPPKEFEETWSDFANLVTYPSEDLLVSLGLYSGLDDLVFSVGVKMWSLAKLQTQEGAADDFLLILDQSEDFSPHYSMHIEEDVIAVFAQPGSGSQDESAQLALINWKTEVLILDTFAVAHDTDPEFPRHSLFSLPYASGPTSDFGSSFGFLSRRSYLLTHTHDSGQIQIYTFECDSDESSPIHRATLMLPQLQPGSELMETTIVTSPFPGHVPKLGALFSKSRERCIYVIGLRYQTGSASQWYRLAMRHYDLHKYTLSSSPHPRILNWEDWGPSQTRMIYADACPMPGEVYGERVGFPIEDSLAVFDFNIGAARSQFDSPNSSFVREPSIVGHGLFVELAMTWLPCRLSKREMDGDRESTFIIDQERVLEVEDQVGPRVAPDEVSDCSTTPLGHYGLKNPLSKTTSTGTRTKSDHELLLTRFLTALRPPLWAQESTVKDDQRWHQDQVGPRVAPDEASDCSTTPLGHYGLKNPLSKTTSAGTRTKSDHELLLTRFLTALRPPLWAQESTVKDDQRWHQDQVGPRVAPDEVSDCTTTPLGHYGLKKPLSKTTSAGTRTKSDHELLLTRFLTALRPRSATMGSRSHCQRRPAPAPGPSRTTNCS
ncbi:hypothetical protein C8F04DRAFT_1195593 [Mycena alexandri]|uniref:F-box domain-containing protein n=1 Tax=Mycena alexandri TaxID=1745969 RepID=A0AAD6WQI1_9AGAR|nr:hypothetical protein C8F04DRAFT_1195593 [Mycena alexandri]